MQIRFYILILLLNRFAMENTSADSWVGYTTDNHFPLQNIPFGAFASPKDGATHCCTRVGDWVIDLSWLENEGILAEHGNLWKELHDNGKKIFSHEHLNKYMDLSKEHWHEARVAIQNVFKTENRETYETRVLENCAFKHNEVIMTMPVFIRDYTDFYSSKNHAYNVGCMFRGPDNALQANWLHLPVGYHGRASSVVLTGTDVRRPKGQVTADKLTPNWSECKRLDFELEVGTFIGNGNKLGDPINIKGASDHIFGLCLVNDWSARDM
jgi:fumarylacetoacetase